MPDIFFEDIEPGTVSTYGSHRVDRDAMVAFAREFDAQPFHLDEAAAAASPVGRLIASGWYTSALQMRMLCDAWLLRSASLGGPGVEELKWLQPVMAGDILSVRQTIVEKQVSKSRPGMGLVRFTMETLTGDGVVVMRQAHLGMFGLRHGAPRSQAEPGPLAVGPPAPVFPPEDLERAPRVYDEVEIGRGLDLGPYEFTAEGVVRFARLFDPQPFHLDEGAAASGPFGALAASGWHTASAWMRRFAARLDRMDAAGGRPQISVSPGSRDLRWMRPVYAGETIRYASEPIEKRPLASRPGWGVVSSRNSGWNGRGEQVFEFTGSAFWAMRDANGAP